MNQHSEQAKAYQQFYRKHLLENVIPFWLNSDLVDDSYGGYLSSVDREGRCYNTDKSVWFQGRSLWTFAALCNRYGIRDEWKTAAEAGRSFLAAHCIDTDGRMFFTVDREGRPLRKRRYMYSEGFYALAMAEYGQAFDDADAIAKAEETFALMLRLYRDPTSDPFKITPKSYASTRSERGAAVPMLLLSVAQLLRRCVPAKAAYYNTVAEEIANDILTYHYKPELKAMLEYVLSDGSCIDNPSGRLINPGHSAEIAWFLMSQAVYTDDPALSEKALRMFDWAFERGWDKEYGGVFCFVDLYGRPCEQTDWDMKLWWVHGEMLIASLMAYAMTGDEKYWSRFELLHEYAFTHFPDETYGEWYGYLHRDGTVALDQKGSLWKGPYHLPRCLMLCDRLLGLLAEGKSAEPLL